MRAISRWLPLNQMTSQRPSCRLDIWIIVRLTRRLSLSAFWSVWFATKTSQIGYSAADSLLWSDPYHFCKDTSGQRWLKHGLVVPLPMHRLILRLQTPFLCQRALSVSLLRFKSLLGRHRNNCKKRRRSRWHSPAAAVCVPSAPRVIMRAVAVTFALCLQISSIFCTPSLFIRTKSLK